MPKIVDHEERRREISARAIPIFAREGFHDANISNIAELCGFGRTTIYKYFKDKNEIFLFALDDIFRRFQENADTIVSDDGLGAVDRLVRLLECLVRESIEERDRMSILLDLLLRLRRDDEGYTEGIRARMAGLRSVFERTIDAGIQSGELRKAEAPLLAFVLFSLLESFVLQHSLYGNVSLPEAMGATRFLLDGLRSRPEGLR